MSSKEKEKLTNSCEDSNSQKINDKGRQLLETAANALNSENPDGGMGFGSHEIKYKDNPSNITIDSKNKKTKEGQHLEYKKDDIEKENW